MNRHPFARSLITRKVIEKETGALFHLVAIHIENLGANPMACSGRTIRVPLDEDDFCVSISGSVIVAHERGNSESLGEKILEAGQHLHGKRCDLVQDEVNYK